MVWAKRYLKIGAEEEDLGFREGFSRKERKGRRDLNHEIHEKVLACRTCRACRGFRQD